MLHINIYKGVVVGVFELGPTPDDKPRALKEEEDWLLWY
jgi:hypothetical protein